MWEHRIVATVQLEMEGKESVTVVETLHPGMSWNWRGFVITPLSISQAPTPLLSEKFLTDGNELALAGKLDTDLFCESKELAEGFNCTLAPSACAHCEPDPENPEVTCQCRQWVGENVFLDMERRLPLLLQKLSLRHEGPRVFAETKYAPVQLMVKGEQVRMVTEIHQT
jgi:hypothetical protein